MSGEPILVVDVLLEASEVLGYDTREAALAWASALHDDLARAVREAPRTRWLGALADALDQRLVWQRFRHRVDDDVPERAAAVAEMRARGPDHPANLRLAELSAQSKSADAGKRAEALRLLGEDHAEFMQSELGLAFAAQATDAMLDARIDELRAMLDVNRLLAAHRAWPHDETRAQRDERWLREALADAEEILRAPADAETASLWGANGGRAFRRLSPALVERYKHAANELRAKLSPVE